MAIDIKINPKAFKRGPEQLVMSYISVAIAREVLKIAQEMAKLKSSK